MAVNSPPIRRRSVLLAKIESTTGTAESLSGTDGAFNVYNLQFTPNVTVDDREKQGGFGMNKSTPGTRSGTITFETDLVGNGASGTPDWFDTFLPACGFSLSGGTATLGTVAAQPSLTMACYHAGKVYKIAGAAGDWTINLNAGRAGRMSFTFQGKLAADADAALPTPTFPSTLPPRWAVSSGFQVDSGDWRVSTCTIAANNEVTLREDANDATGFYAAAITGRRPVISVDPELMLAATYNIQDKYINGTTVTVDAVLGTVANNIITISTNSGQIINPGSGNRNNVMTEPVEILCFDDDLSIALT